MAVVTTQTLLLTRVNDANALGTVWLDLSGTAAVLEGDFVYQTANSVSEKVKTSEGGVRYYNSATSHNYSGTPRIALLKMLISTPGILSSTAATSLIAEIGTGARSAYYRYYLNTNVTYPVDRSWIVYPIDPSIAGYRSATVGTPTLTAIDYYALAATMTATSKSENVAMDAIDFIDYGGGLRLYGGDGADADGTFQHFADFDFGTTGNRYGLCTTREGVYFILGVLTIGQSGAATVFTDENQAVVFRDGRFGPGGTGVDFVLSNGASTVVTITNCLFSGRGNVTTADSRPDYNVTGASGFLNLPACTFTGFRNITISSASNNISMLGVTFTNGAQVLVSSASNAPDLSNSNFSGCTGAANASFLVWTSSAATGGKLDGSTFTKGTTATHALELGLLSPLTLTLTNVTVSGYNASNAQNDSVLWIRRTTGTVTINLVGCAGTFSYRTDGATVVIQQSVTLTVRVQNKDKTPLQNVQTSIFLADSPFTQLMNEDTDVSGIATEPYNYPGSPVDVIVKARKSESTDNPRYIGFADAQQITAAGLTLVVTLRQTTLPI